MGTRLNPDGTKIRALRIQRGWTQEQLAEIAGISLRTVQRAEAANSAAFETMKALAAAFETDFDRLLKQEPGGVATRETKPTVSSQVECADPAPEQIASEQAPLAVRRIWPTQIIALSALTVGLVLGITSTYHLNKHSHSLPAESHFVANDRSEAQELFSEPPLQNKSLRIPSKPKPVPDSTVQAATFGLEIARKDKDSSLPDVGTPAAGPANVAETASLELIQPSSSPDLLSLKMMPMPLVFPDEPIIETALSDTSDYSMQEAQASGAVRQAVGLAVKKTGGFVSKAGASIKRAF